MRKKKKLLCFLIIVICLNVFNVFADNENDLRNKINNLENELESNRGDKEKINRLMNDIEVELEKLSIEIEKYDYKLEKINAEIAINQENIDKFEIQIDQLKEELIEEKQNLVDKKELYAKQSKFLYVKGFSSQLELIFSSTSWDSFMTNLTLTRKLSKYNKKLFEDITKSMEKIESDTKKVEAKKREMEELKAENIKKQNEFQASKDKISNLESNAKNKKSEYMETLETYNIQETNAERQIKEAQKQLAIIKERKKGKPKVDNGDVTGDDIIDYASQFLDDPYYWGGDRPYDGTYGSSFDCSGLVQYVYKHYGITTGRTTYNQIDHPNGRYVDRSDLKPGDLVFFGSKYDPHHVGLYIGNNAYLHAPRTGDVIKISPMTRRDYLEGRRFLPD